MKNTLLRAIENYLSTWHSKDVHTADEHPELIEAKNELRGAAMEGRKTTGRVFPHILVAVDHGKHPALTAAFRLAEAIDGKLTLLHVVDTTGPEMHIGPYSTRAQLLDALREHGRELLKDAEATVPSGLSVQPISREGHPVEEIIAASQSVHADMIVMGTHKRSAFAAFFLGSTSEGVVRKSPIPVLLIADSETTVSEPRLEASHA